jgi:hypothetical protein
MLTLRGIHLFGGEILRLRSALLDQWRYRFNDRMDNIIGDPGKFVGWPVHGIARTAIQMHRA